MHTDEYTYMTYMYDVTMTQCVHMPEIVILKRLPR